MARIKDVWMALVAGVSMWLAPAMAVAQQSAAPGSVPAPAPSGRASGAEWLWIIAAVAVLAIIWWAATSSRRRRTATRTHT